MPARVSRDSHTLRSRDNTLDVANAAFRRWWYRARAYARPLTRWSVPVSELRGRALHTGSDTTLIVAGWKRTVEYYANRFLEKKDEPREIARVPLLGLPAALERFRRDAELVIARVPSPSSSFLFGISYLQVPEAVEARLHVAGDAGLLDRASTRARRNVARVRKNALTWTVSTRSADIDRFYDEFYVPFLRHRYGELAQEHDRATIRRAFRRGCLLWIWKDDAPVAGALLQPQGEGLCWRVMGARIDGEDPAKSGALAAIYVFGVECAKQYGYEWLDLGFSKASPRDGVLSHKGSWGASVYCPWKVDHDILFRWSHLTGNVAHFLHTTPLIFREDDALSVVTCTSAGGFKKGADPIALGRKVAMAGLRNVYVAGVDQWAWNAAATDRGAALHLAAATSSHALRVARHAP